jgi:hypothetical protein
MRTGPALVGSWMNAIFADGDLVFFHESEDVGVERQRLVLVVDHDARELDPHESSLV